MEPAISTRTIVIFVIGACFGTVAALTLVPGPKPAPPCPPPVTVAPPIPAPAPAAVPAMAPPVDRRLLEKPAVNVAPPPALPAGASNEEILKENEGLREQLRAVQQKLDLELRASAQEHGVPATPPKELAPRFSPEQLRQSVNDALKEAGFTNAQVTSVDCTEYPCIVHGEGMGDREDFEKLEQTSALAAYKDDGRNAMGWGRNGADGKPTHTFGFAVYPKIEDPKEAEAMRKRVRYRGQLMQDQP